MIHDYCVSQQGSEEQSSEGPSCVSQQGSEEQSPENVIFSQPEPSSAWQNGADHLPSEVWIHLESMGEHNQ